MKYPELEGKRAVVTGAGKGIGFECVKALISQGCFVAAITRSQSDVAKLNDTFGSSNLIQTLCLDVANWHGVDTFFKQLKPFHFLISNAAVGFAKPFLDITEEEFDGVFDVNIKAAFHVAQAAAKSMVDHNVKGVIVNISSQSSKIALYGLTAYSCSKAALDMLTKMMCLELGSKGIRAVSINPTVVVTDMSRKYRSDPVRSGPMMSRIPLGRFAEVDEVVKPILFCLSDGAAMITGCEIPVDGGVLAN